MFDIKAFNPLRDDALNPHQLVGGTKEDAIRFLQERIDFMATAHNLNVVHFKYLGYKVNHLVDSVLSKEELIILKNQLISAEDENAVHRLIGQIHINTNGLHGEAENTVIDAVEEKSDLVAKNIHFEKHLQEVKHAMEKNPLLAPYSGNLIVDTMKKKYFRNVSMDYFGPLILFVRKNEKLADVA